MKVIIVILTLLSINSYSQNLKDTKLNQSNKLDKSGLKDGLWFNYNQLGVIVSAEFYKNGGKNGAYEIYYENGNISEKGFYCKGKRDSTLITFFESGKMIGKVDYKDGKMNGVLIYYNENGDIIYRAQYINGKFDDTYKDFYEDESILSDNASHSYKNIKDTIYSEDINIENAYEYTVYENGVSIYNVLYVKGKKLEEKIFEENMLVKRIIYSETPPFKVKEITYWGETQFPIIETYDKGGVLIKKNEVPTSPHLAK